MSRPLKRVLATRCTQDKRNPIYSNYSKLTTAYTDSLYDASVFKTIYLCAEWMDTGAEARLTVCVNFPSSITTNETRVGVVEVGRGSEVEVVWLATLQYAAKMMKP